MDLVVEGVGVNTYIIVQTLTKNSLDQQKATNSWTSVRIELIILT